MATWRRGIASPVGVTSGLSPGGQHLALYMGRCYRSGPFAIQLLPIIAPAHVQGKELIWQVSGTHVLIDILNRPCYCSTMPRRSSKRGTGDINLLAVQITTEATEGQPPEDLGGRKNPHAVALGRLGGLKGGKARASKLTAEQRQDIARRAATARWHRSE